METTATNDTSPTSTPSVFDLIGIEEVARITRLSQKTIVAYTVMGKIPSLKIAHARLYDRRAIRAWMTQRRSMTSRRSVRVVEPLAAERAV
jgi:Helix-turn-helix domain